MSEILSSLREQGVVKLEATFAGSGDEGSVEEVYLTRLVLVPGERVGAPTRSESRREEAEYRSEAWAYAQNLANDAGFDWWNNEGGRGSLTLDVVSGVVTYERYKYRQVEDELEPLTVTVGG